MLTTTCVGGATIVSMSNMVRALDEELHEYGIDIINELPTQKFDAAIAAVAHKAFEGMDILALLKDKHVIFDVKCTLNRSIIDARL